MSQNPLCPDNFDYHCIFKIHNSSFRFVFLIIFISKFGEERSERAIIVLIAAKVLFRFLSGSFFRSFSARYKHRDIVSVEEDLFQLGDLFAVGGCLVFCHIFENLTI